MMKNRVRFAPSPTGLMHIGNIRTALMNYLFAKKNDGVFVLRIEDTDPKRNFDEGGKTIIKHLDWLNLCYEEGPNRNDSFGPYFQSQRQDIYTAKLKELEENDFIYRCFCTTDELDKKRVRQIALKKPPRYDRACSFLSKEQIDSNMKDEKSFVWRMKVDSNKKIAFEDIAHGTLHFDLKNFSDFPLTRGDGSFTFMFANCIDDIEMKMSHVLRGEDHLTNTVGQFVIMKALNAPIPLFWHLPILCNITGKKLSKRDQGFSLEDLKADGFLPEAIINYLGIIGGSFEKEILPIDELADAYNFDHLSKTSQIKYDIEKLKWVNHKWISGYDLAKLTELCKPFIAETFDIAQLSDEKLQQLIQSVQTDLITLQDAPQLLKFYFEKPVITSDIIDNQIADKDIQNKILDILKSHCNSSDFDTFLSNTKASVKENDISFKDFFSLLRLLLTGSPKGLGMHELEKCLGFDEIKSRICKN